MMETSRATLRVIPKIVQFIGIAFVRYSKNNPAQLANGPGKTGKIEPIIPSNANKKPMINRKISIS